MMLDTDVLRAISRLTHAPRVKTTWPWDRHLRFVANLGDEPWVLGLVLVNGRVVPNRVLRVLDAFADRMGAKFPGHEADCVGTRLHIFWIAGVRWVWGAP